jgi:hypothetical protein
LRKFHRFRDVGRRNRNSAFTMTAAVPHHTPRLQRGIVLFYSTPQRITALKSTTGLLYSRCVSPSHKTWGAKAVGLPRSRLRPRGMPFSIAHFIWEKIEMLTRENLYGFSFREADSAYNTILQRHLPLCVVQRTITVRLAHCTCMPYSDWPSVTEYALHLQHNYPPLRTTAKAAAGNPSPGAVIKIATGR